MADRHDPRPEGSQVGDHGAGSVPGDGAGDQDDERPRQRRRGRRILAVCGLVVLLVIGLTAAGIYALSENIGNNVSRVPDVFGPLQDAPRPPATAAMTFLLVGTDSRSAEPTTGTEARAPDFVYGAQRSDVLMIVQVSPDRTSASVVSVPRDSWVDIPGSGMNKINAAYSFGGPSLLIKTVENLTALRIDHFAVIDFAGFQSMVDSVGGIDVRIAEATSDRGVEFHQGLNRLDGAQALVYVRQRYGLPRGDLDRAQRQQNALRALLSKAASSGALTDPVGLYDLLGATSHTVSVDDTLSNGGLRSLAFDLRGLRPNGVTFMSAPVRGLGREGAQSVVYLDDQRSSELWDSLRAGTLATYAAKYPADSLGASTP